MAAESSTPGELSQDGVIGDAGAANRLRGGDAKLAGTSSDAAGPCDEENGFIQVRCSSEPAPSRSVSPIQCRTRISMTMSQA